MQRGVPGAALFLVPTGTGLILGGWALLMVGLLHARWPWGLLAALIPGCFLAGFAWEVVRAVLHWRAGRTSRSRASTAPYRLRYALLGLAAMSPLLALCFTAPEPWRTVGWLGFAMLTVDGVVFHPLAGRVLDRWRRGV